MNNHITITRLERERNSAIYPLSEALYSYEKTLRNCDENEVIAIETLKNKINTYYDLHILKVNDRYKAIDALKNKYYRIEMYDDYNKKPFNEGYIFIYQVNKTNHMLFALFVPGGSDNYNAGIQDICKSFVDEWNYRFELDEVTKEEFLKQAHSNIENVLEYRINKIEHPIQYKAVWKD